MSEDNVRLLIVCLLPLAGFVVGILCAYFFGNDKTGRRKRE